jgi:hypothetical protein
VSVRMLYHIPTLAVLQDIALFEKHKWWSFCPLPAGGPSVKR